MPSKRFVRLNGKTALSWKGDFHHDLNTQLSYWPAYTGNHLDLEKGFLNWLWENQVNFKAYTKTYFNTSGMNVPGVTTLRGQPMGGWIQYSFGPTVAAWLSHHFYLHWVYSNDKGFIKERAYPWIKEVAIYLDEISETDQEGKRKLPISSSPEINNNDRSAWFSKTTNFDLALIRWTYEKAAELALELGRPEEAELWSAILKEWPDLALNEDNGGLAVAPDYPLPASHRHFSHIMAWHPLGLIDWSASEKEKAIIKATLEELESIGTDWWTGYSFSWMGNLYARAFMGDKAVETLTIFAENFCLPNSFHVNGEQHDRGFSNFKYRPFTLEGNFAFASALQEMLIQSHTGTVRLFPAIPDSWKEVSFHQFRTRGAFLVSAAKKGGEVDQVEIYSEKGGLFQLKNPFGERGFEGSDAWEIKDGGILLANMKMGEKLILEAR